MFSLEKFYFILYANLLKPASMGDTYFYPFGSIDVSNMTTTQPLEISKQPYPYHYCFYYDQEPFSGNVATSCNNHKKTMPYYNKDSLMMLATGESSAEIDTWCEQNNYKNWYYFFHGFAALDWYRDYQYLPKFENQFTKVFITYNRLVTEKRSYRLNFVAQLMQKELLKFGHVSLILEDNGHGTWQQELNEPTTLLSVPAKTLINEQIGSLSHSLIIDKENPPGHASADTGYEELMMHKSALWHVVTETVFYDNKLHLTEKIFKPITAKRPFMLMGAVNNLAYLKSYGFKTFDRWIDESYDSETDPDKRIEMIVAELEKLCKLSNTELTTMYQEMQDILEFNFNHFYGSFKKIIVNELVLNFKDIITNWNSQDSKYPIDLNHIDFDQVVKLLSQ